MKTADWIIPKKNVETEAPLFIKKFSLKGTVKSAVLEISARGVYEAHINGSRVGNEYFTPGWTVYEKRIQVQKYDVADMLGNDNKLEIQLVNGWYFGVISGCRDSEHWATANKNDKDILNRECAVIAELTVWYADGSSEVFATDDDWDVYESQIRYCDFYNGIIYDAGFEPTFISKSAVSRNNNRKVLIARQGEPIISHEHIMPAKIIRTPRGETVIDFGQNLTGTIEITVNANAGDEISLSFGEILDKDGNFYNENYRRAKSLYQYICKEGEQSWRPTLTFYGFRYVRVDKFPGNASQDNFKAIVIHSRLKRTGYIETSSPLLNRLYSNIIWGQKDNYLDVPTDCPQRDERYGWTGDAQVFVRTASYNFDVERFFRKWLTDMKLEQQPNGDIPPVIPAASFGENAAAWGDAVTVCTWQMYLTYGDKQILKIMFPAMKKWVDRITDTTTTKYMWTGQWQFGDWLELNAPYGEFKGKTRDDIISTAYYAYSTLITAKAGRVLKKDMTEYETLYKNIVETFKQTFKDDFRTQTECAVALYFNLTDDKPRVAKQLAKIIEDDGNMIQTGFVGTAYILHALSQNGYGELAYKLLLRTEYPSWLYPVTKGATTIWEHWDGIKQNGDLWPAKMNSFNHYAYGSVGDWLYCGCGGINTVEEYPGFERIRFEPIVTDQLESFSASIDTRHGKASSKWWHEGNEIRYEIVTPTCAEAVIKGKTYKLNPGTYRF